MRPTIDLQPDTILLDVAAAGLAEVLDAAASALAARSGMERAVIRGALADAAAESTFAIGAGIAVPHVAVPGLSRRASTLIRTVEPVSLDAPDREPVDLFFVLLSPAGDPSAHLQFLAHLAGMCRSRVFRDGLRAATTPREALELIAAAEARLGGAAAAMPASGGKLGLAIISVAGERAADTILLGLLRRELSSATIVDAQTLQDAASREVPLFAGFRDLFGDPGGRRMIFAHVDLEHADEIASIVQQACEDEPSASAELVVLPIAHRRTWSPPAPAPTRAGH